MGLGGDKITLVNIYSQFSMPADIFVHKLERILEGFYRGNIMILGDINAKSPLWHCPETNGKGEKIRRHNKPISTSCPKQGRQTANFSGKDWCGK